MGTLTYIILIECTVPRYTVVLPRYGIIVCTTILNLKLTVGNIYSTTLYDKDVDYIDSRHTIIQLLYSQFIY